MKYTQGQKIDRSAKTMVTLRSERVFIITTFLEIFGG